MDKLTYTRQHSTREANKIEFEVEEDLNIHEFRIVCIRLAHAMGYTKKSIDDAFGSEEGLSFKQHPETGQLLFG